MGERTFFVLVQAAQEKEAARRILRELPRAKLARRAKGKVVFSFAGDVSELAKLSWAQGLYILAAHFDDVGRDRAAVDVLAAQVAQADIEQALGVWAKLAGMAAPDSFSLEVTRAGLHGFSSFDVERAVTGLVARKRGWKPVAEGAALVMRVEIYSDEALLSVKLPVGNKDEGGRMKDEGGRRDSGGAAALCCLILAAAMSVGARGQAEQKAVCAMCGREVDGTQPVTVADFGQGTTLRYDNLACALKDMALRMATSLAEATCPVSLKVLKVIRTGIKWTADPPTARFMLLKEGMFAFASQKEFIQFLARNADAAKQRPKPLTLRQALAVIGKPPPRASPR